MHLEADQSAERSIPGIVVDHDARDSAVEDLHDRVAARDQMHDDPVLFAVKDRISLAAGALVVICLLIARYG